MCRNCRIPLPGTAAKTAVCHGWGDSSVPADKIDSINRVERRYLTIMFCDLVDSTGLVTRLDLEDLLQLIQTYRNLSADIIKDYGGFTACYMGDGIMSYFGYPRAHEDDAERAVHTALELLAACKDRNTGLRDVDGNRIRIRIGIASGLVVVGSLAGTGAGAVMEETVIGQAPNLAARLQSLAQPDTVIVSTETRNLIANHFRFKNIGMQSLAGFEKTQTLWQVINETVSQTRFNAGRRFNQSGLVGRSREFKRIIRQWKMAQRGVGRVILLRGETGIGKSKLLGALCAHISRGNSNRFIYRCSPLHKNDNLYSGLAQLQASLGSVPGQSPGRQTATGASPEAEPCIIILEDAHWIDPVSLKRLTRLIPQVRGKRILLAISYRIQFEPPVRWLEQDHVEKISLHPLDRTAAELFIREVARTRHIPARLVCRIMDKSDGVPLFLEEVTRTVLQARHTDKRSLQHILENIEPPEKVRTILMTRLDQDTTSREAAQIGAALGREFRYDMLTRIWPHDRKQLNEALISLCNSGVLSKTGNADNRSYAFKWQLMREVAYQSMLKCVRQNLHRQIIRVLLEHFPDTARFHPELLDRHSFLAGASNSH